MLSHLIIKNFGLIDHLSIDFCKELNIFTGETGAGKSILIDALRYALGERIKSSQVRDRERPCIVEAVFELSSECLSQLDSFSDYLDKDEPELIISRTYTPDGRNKNKINGFSLTVTQLKELGAHLIDFHGPHDHQLLFAESSHIKILDRLSVIDDLKNKYSQRYSEYTGWKNKLSELNGLRDSRERELDILQYQLQELEQVSLDPEEHERIVHESSRINNMEKLYECVSQLINIIENEQSGISKITSEAFIHMNTLNEIDESTENFTEILSRIQDDSTELASSLRDYLDSLSFEPEKANDINTKTDIYYTLLKKYGPSIKDVKEFHLKARDKYDLLIDLEHNDAEIHKNIDRSLKAVLELAKELSNSRKNTAKELEKTIEKELKELGFMDVRFQCRISKNEIGYTGHDNVCFYISPNTGEELKPLAEIISSGEAARVMLALKKALTKVDPIPVLVFDEIDSQIGGRLGTITGKKLKELSQNRQVLLITHLPQIASFGDYHYKVSKSIKEKRTVTEISLLDDDQRIDELAKMMSGDKESRIAVKHAHDMLANASE